MPPGLSPLHREQYPPGIKLSGTLELVRLEPRFDYPLGCRPFPEWSFYPRPAGMRLPLHVHLFLSEGDRGGGVLPVGRRAFATGGGGHIRGLREHEWRGGHG